jgi:kynureninase
MAVRVGDLVGRIIGGSPGEAVMQPNVSICQPVVLTSFDWAGRRNKIATEDLNFPSNLLSSLLFRARRNAPARVVTVPGDRLLDAIDEDRPLVLVSHVGFRNSLVRDWRRSSNARMKGARR